MPLGISCVILTFNEEKLIAQCIEYHKPFMDEIIVVDSRSTDATAAIARMHGARIIEEPRRDNFGELRNISMNAASHDWVLMVDADELFDPTFLGGMRKQIEMNPGVVAFKIDRTNYYRYNDPVKIGDWQIRLVNRRFVEYHGVVHERACLKGTDKPVDSNPEKCSLEERPILHLPRTPKESRKERWKQLEASVAIG